MLARVRKASAAAHWRFALLPVLARVRKAPPPRALDDFHGETGRVARALDPVGTVLLRGELWSATSDRPLATGVEVVVIGREGLNLRVSDRAQTMTVDESLISTE